MVVVVVAAAAAAAAGVGSVGRRCRYSVGGLAPEHTQFLRRRSPRRTELFPLQPLQLAGAARSAGWCSFSNNKFDLRFKL